ncbi:Uncharacterised protein [Mycobacteroides abscessus subsp. abscessus]|nr:Uncharacterised protein [Mycobacteroides abscessus subsp. abscessus]
MVGWPSGAGKSSRAPLLKYWVAMWPSKTFLK